MELPVMIVDDDPVAVYLLVRLLKRQKISDNPTTFSGAREAIRYFDKHDQPEQKYVVFLDINMPGMRAWDLLDIIAEKPYADRVYFFIVSSSVDQADHDRIQQYGQVIAFLEKPVEAKMLEGLKAWDMIKDM